MESIKNYRYVWDVSLAIVHRLGTQPRWARRVSWWSSCSGSYSHRLGAPVTTLRLLLSRVPFIVVVAKFVGLLVTVFPFGVDVWYSSLSSNSLKNIILMLIVCWLYFIILPPIHILNLCVFLILLHKSFSNLSFASQSYLSFFIFQNLLTHFS
jgi:hypothetical protein